MNHSLLSIMFVALFVSAAEAQTRSSSGGGLSSNRGISNSESLAISAVLRETAGGRAGAEGTTPAPRSGRYSPDYYRVYSQRHQMAAGARRVAVATPAPAKAKAPKAATGATVVAPPAVKPAPAKPTRVAVAPRAAVGPVPEVKPLPPKPVAAKPARVAVAPRVAAMPVRTPKPVPAKPVRVVVAPRIAPVTPVREAAAPAKPKRVAMAPRVAVAPAPSGTIYAKPAKLKKAQTAAAPNDAARVLFR